MKGEGNRGISEMTSMPAIRLPVVSGLASSFVLSSTSGVAASVWVVFLLYAYLPLLSRTCVLLGWVVLSYVHIHLLFSRVLVTALPSVETQNVIKSIDSSIQCESIRATETSLNQNHDRLGFYYGIITVYPKTEVKRNKYRQEEMTIRLLRKQRPESAAHQGRARKVRWETKW